MKSEALGDLREALLRRWEYEVWANELWAQALPNFQNEDRACRVFRHIYSCYSGWAPLVANWQVDEVELERDVPLLHKLWRGVIQTADLHAMLELGGGRRISALDLIQHVMNHGTYHRGHLRGLAEAEGLTDFPETDLVRYAVQHPEA